MLNDPGITGRGPMRDRFILCNALAYAIVTINRLPPRQQEASNARDMEVILDHLTERFLSSEHFLEGALRHIDGIGLVE